MAVLLFSGETSSRLEVCLICMYIAQPVKCLGIYLKMMNNH